MKIERALLSVWDKEGIVELARQLREMEVEILSTGGTGRKLEEAGIPFQRVSDYTGFPEIFEGRVKTLHPRIHAGILARLDREEDRKTLSQQDVAPIHLVVVNLYPFQQTVARPGVTLEKAIENIDIGGPTLVRAAAKNFAHVTVIVEPSDYAGVVAEMKANQLQTRTQTRLELAQKAFAHTAAYEAAISEYLEARESSSDEMPSSLNMNLILQSSLRYGENPHQRAALYRNRFGSISGLAAAAQLQGKHLSFNNYLDLDAAWSLVSEFEDTACVLVKHNNPCGVALGASPQEAYRKGLECDPVSAFGSIVAFNRDLDKETAQSMADLFVEAVIAPGYTDEARDVFSKKKNLRVMEMELEKRMGGAGTQPDLQLKHIRGAVLAQDRDNFFVQADDLKCVTRRRPEPEELEDLLFCWTVCKHVKSNAIVFGRNQRTLGIGAGQMSRVDSVRIAGEKSRSSLEGAIMASDAFFPFRDGIDEAARKGVKAVIQPGGSIRDSEVIQAADEHGMAMVFTGIRHFRH